MKIYEKAIVQFKIIVFYICAILLGADYDGDMLFFRGIFSKEANEEARKKIWDSSNIYDSNGNFVRGITKIGKDVIVSLYSLTKN